MKLRVSFALVIFALLFTNLCYAQIIDYNFLGGGARARAMGGAFFAVSDDPSAGSWNPAGLAQLDLPQMNLTFYSSRAKTLYDFDISSIETKMSNDLILSGGVAIPFKVSGYQMVGSASYERVSVFSDQFFYEDINRSEETHGNVDAVTLSLGRELLKGFSFGMAVNIYTGGYTFKALQLYVYNADTSIFYHPLIKGDYSGLNLQFGTMYKVQGLSFGAVVKTPFTLKEKVDAKMEYDLIVGDLVNPGTNHAHGLYYFAENKWKLPLIWGIGSAYKTGNLIVAADVEYRDFSKAELTYQDAYIPNMNSPTKTINLGWEKGTQFRIGGEYIIHTKLGKVPIRAGYRNDPKTFTSIGDVVYDVDTLGSLVETNPGEKGERAEGSIISFGTGIGWSQIMFDFTYEYSKYDYSWSGRIEEDGVVLGYFRQTTTSKDNRMMFNFTGYF